MKKIYLLISSISLALLLTACGGGGSTDESRKGVSDGNDSNNGDIVKVVDCSTGEVTSIESGDILLRDTTNTMVTITDTDGHKTVCVDVGSAHISR